MVLCTNLVILDFWKNISTFSKTWFLRRDLRFAGLHFAVRMAKILVYPTLSWDLWRNKRLEVKYIFCSRITEHVCNKVDLLLLLATYVRCLIIFICTVFKFILYSMLEVSFQWYSIVYPPNRKMYGWGWSPPGQVHGWEGRYAIGKRLIRKGLSFLHNHFVSARFWGNFSRALAWATSPNFSNLIRWQIQLDVVVILLWHDLYSTRIKG